MLKLQSASVSIALASNGTKYCRVNLNAVDDVNPDISLSTERMFNVDVDLEVQSLLYEVNKLITQAKTDNEVS